MLNRKNKKSTFESPARAAKLGNKPDVEIKPQPALIVSELESLLDETLDVVQKSKPNNFANIQTFSTLEKNAKNLTQLYALKSRKKRNLLRIIISYWDIILLCFLNLIFATYLSFYIASYYSSDAQLKRNFYNRTNTFYKWLMANWMDYNGFADSSREECALIMPELFNAALRPFDSCDMCSNLTQIERVRNLSKEDFLRKYAYTGVPVIVTDAIKNWSALRVLNFDFLRNLYLDIEEKNELDRKHNRKEQDDGRLSCQFFGYKTKFQSLTEVFEKIRSDERGHWTSPWYVGWSNCNNQASKTLRRHYKRPYFLPDDSEMSRVDWIFMGTPGYGADMHIDDVTNPSWQAQISGIKKWTFMPPAECLAKCPLILSANVHPGDIIVFDSNRWFHSTNIIGNDLSLAIGSEYD